MAQTINGKTVPVSAMMTPFGEVTMSSREIAELTGKQHGHVCRDIEIMFEQLGEHLAGYIHAWTHPQNGQKYREFRLSREYTECLITGYSAALRMKIIHRLHELESNRWSVPKTFSEALQLAAKLEEEKDRLTEKAIRDAPKVAYFDDYINAGDTMSIRETAKILNVPEKHMIAALLRDRVLFRQSGYLLPNAIHQKDGYFTLKTGKSDAGHAYRQTRVTPRGIEWLSRRYASELAG